MSQLTELRDYLLSKVQDITEARPCVVTLFGKSFDSCLYTVEKPYGKCRAVNEGMVHPDELYKDHRFYIIGERPKKLQKGHHVFVWEHSLPLDSRIERSVGEWYIAGYSPNPIGEQYKRYYPFGQEFLVKEWTVSTYGYYKDHKIDTLENFRYKRHPMTVSFQE